MSCMACMAHGREGTRRLTKSRPPARCSCLRLALGLELVPVWCVCVSWSALWCVGRSVFLLLSQSLTPLRLIAGAMDDANLNFALIAALFCASSGGRNPIISESLGSPSHIGVPYIEDTMDRPGAGRNANALSTATIETSTVVSGSSIHSIERAGSSAPTHVCGWPCV